MAEANSDLESEKDLNDPFADVDIEPPSDYETGIAKYKAEASEIYDTGNSQEDSYYEEDAEVGEEEQYEDKFSTNLLGSDSAGGSGRLN